MGKVCISTQTDSVVGVGSNARLCWLAVLYGKWKMGDCRKAQRKDGWLSKLQMGVETRQLQTNKDKPG